MRYTSKYFKTFLLLFGAGIFLTSNAADKDLFQFQVSTTSHSIHIQADYSITMSSPTVEMQIKSASDQQILWEGKPEILLKEGKLYLTKENLLPALWTPTQPRLYYLSITVTDLGKTLQKSTFRVGFRDFETKNGQIFLNGHPLFLRGIAINPPGRGIPEALETSRTFAEEYVRFMKSIHVNIIRIPDDQTWYDVCDEMGMLVFGGNYSAAVDGQSPPKDYDKAVKWYCNEKFGPIMHHPSLVMYALTNEVPFNGEIAKKWVQFLDYAFAKLKIWDPSRLYIGNAGYGLGKSGDICDLHRYWGWYYASPFTFLHIRDYDQITFPDKIQPLTFTECVGNYTGPDGRYNLTPDHKNPVSQQNWTGHAPQDQQAQLADEHQCFSFKQATELMRRLRRINPESSGVFPFTILFRNWHTISTFTDMVAKPVAWQAKLSYSPVLLSWENWQTQAYAGSEVKPAAHIINDSDDFSDLKNVRLVVRLLDKAYTHLTTDTIKLPDIPYYGIYSTEVSVRLPETLFEGNYQLEGLVLSGKQEISRNVTNIFVARKNTLPLTGSSRVKLYDPLGISAKAFRINGIPFDLISNADELKATDCVVIGENAADSKLAKAKLVLNSLLNSGARLIVLRQDSLHQRFIQKILPFAVKFPLMDIDDPTYPSPPRPSRNSFNINPERPDHPVFKGISRSELRVWSDYTAYREAQKGFPSIYPVTDGFVLADKKDIGKVAILADYSVGLEGIALGEFFHGKGSLLLSGFDLVKRANIDPIADRLLRNMISYMAGLQQHENHIMLDAPVLWGEYETEKGMIIGVYNGLMINSKPALYGSYENSPLLLKKDGHLFAEKGGGWNNAAGKQYVPYGRRLFGPYYHKDFGGVPEPFDAEGLTGEGFFWCRVPQGTRLMTTIIWNPSQNALPVQIKINEVLISDIKVQPGEYKSIESRIPENATELKVGLQGDRSLVLLQTNFD